MPTKAVTRVARAAVAHSPDSIVRRHALLEHLTEGPGDRFTFIEAPGGYGKSTLLAQLSQDDLSKGRHVASIAVQPNDSADSLTAATLARLWESGLQISSSGCPAAGTWSADALCEGIQRNDKPCTLILDRAEDLTEASFGAFLEVMVRRHPRNLRMIVACRKNPGIDVSRLIIEGTLAQVGPQQLKLTERELAAALDGQWDDKDVSAFHRATDGWPAAVGILQRLSVRSVVRLSTAQLIAECLDSAGARFNEEVLSHAGPEERQFIQEIAAFGSCKASMLDYVRGEHDSAALMRRTYQKYGVLTQSAEFDADTYMPHPLLARSVSEARAAIDSSAYRYARAAEWCYSVGNKVATIEYAIASGDYRLAVEYFEKFGGLTLCLTDGL